MTKLLHITLVTLQMICLIVILVTGSLLPRSFVMLMMFSISVLFGLWAIAEMKFRVNIFPELRNDSKLIITEPYSIVRHPMYTAVLFSSLCLVLNELTVLRAFVWIVLLIVLLIKSSIEDKILRSCFVEFTDFELGTHRLIPYIF